MSLTAPVPSACRIPFENDHWSRPTGGKLSVTHWQLPNESRRTALILVHGHGEHMGRYHDFVERVSTLGMPVIGYDHLGHGQSDGIRGHADGIDELARDLHQIIPDLLERTSCDDAVIFSHSMGALTLGRLLVTRPEQPLIRGAILSGPAFRVPRTPLVHLKILAGRMLSPLAPKATVPTGIDVYAISSDPEYVHQYRSDPLVHDRISLRLGKSLIDDGEATIPMARNVQVPMFVYHGTADRIAAIEGTRLFAKSAPASLVSYHELRGFYHEAHHEPKPEADLIDRMIKDWIGAILDR